MCTQCWLGFLLLTLFMVTQFEQAAEDHGDNTVDFDAERSAATIITLFQAAAANGSGGRTEPTRGVVCLRVIRLGHLKKGTHAACFPLRTSAFCRPTEIERSGRESHSSRTNKDDLLQLGAGFISRSNCLPSQQSSLADRRAGG
ncbi:hypothetical protein XENORESO_017473 [Xenotaenia resolanae]|uniref:Secreted protein n=1 Tax=Xenotaenia resolanae TaxID=208358 RepID=A0ABV0X6P7_9TELE